MSGPGGQYLRRGHVCGIPDRARVGDIWQCACGRRWTYHTPIWDALSGPAWWRRRWPWPRPAKETT